MTQDDPQAAAGTSADPAAGAGGGSDAGTAAAAAGAATGAAAAASAKEATATPEPKTVGVLELDAELATALKAKNLGTQNDLARAYLNLEKKIGEKGLIPPAADASDEEKAAFYNALGRPESPDKYDLGDFKPPEGMPWSEKRQSTALEGMHKLGLTPDQVKGIMSLHVTDMQAAVAEAGFVLEDPATIKAAIDQEFPPGSQKRKDFDAHAQRGAAMLGLDAATVDQLSARAGSKKVLDVLNKIGALSGEDGTLVGAGKAAASVADPAQAKSELQAMQSDPAKRKILLDSNHPEHAALVERRTRLLAVAHPEQAKGV